MAHPDAGAAGTLKHTGARRDNVCQRSVHGKHVVNLLAAWGDGEAHVRMYGFSLQDGRHAHEVEIRGIGAGADADLVDLDGADLL